MTTIGKISAECVICGEESEHTSITSSNAMGSPDLDLRPPEMQRSTMEWWLQECPACGYVAPDISESVASIKAIVEIFEQSKTLSPFVRRSALLERLGDLEGAAENALHAAWDADDRGDDDGAVKSRRRSAAIFKKTLNDIDQDAEEVLVAKVRSIDIFRRAGDFDDARKLCYEVLDGRPDSTLTKIVRYQGKLIEARDVAAHSVEQAQQPDDPLRTPSRGRGHGGGNGKSWNSEIWDRIKRFLGFQMNR